MFYTVPWFVEIGPGQVPGKAMSITQMATLVCNRYPPMPYKARVNLFFLQTGLDYGLCEGAVRLALELGMLEWCDMPEALASMN
jgi:hypothetical protein